MSGHDDMSYDGAPGQGPLGERPDHDEDTQHAGNGTVNHGPESPLGGRFGAPGNDHDEARTTEISEVGDLSQARERRQAQQPPGAAEPAADDGPPAVLGSDEESLRRLFHHAVEELEPTDGTLDHLRRAVPARRARKRQAVVGMAAAALFFGTAVPALVHVSNATDSDANPSIVGSSEQTKDDATKGATPPGGTSSGSGSSAGKASDGEEKDQQQQKPLDPEKGASTGATGGPVATASAATGGRACVAADLGNAVANAGTPDSTGAVYGSFTVSNVSTSSCTVSGSGSVGFTAQGAADSSKITVTPHTAGDAASGLPDPSLNLAGLTLQPGSSYEVKFAWVPSETCPTTGTGTGGTGGTDPSPDPSPTEDATTGSTGEPGAAPQLTTAEGVADGSVAVSYTAETGAPATGTTVSNACAGTIYRTGLLASGS